MYKHVCMQLFLIISYFCIFIDLLYIKAISMSGRCSASMFAHKMAFIGIFDRIYGKIKPLNGTAYKK